MDLDVTEVLDFKTLCVRREGACSEREESSFLLHAPKFNVSFAHACANEERADL